MDPRQFTLVILETDEVRQVRLSGELDLATVEELVAALDTNGDKPIHVDTTELTFIDSTGLAALMNAHRQAPPGRFTLVAGERTRHLLELLDIPDPTPANDTDAA